MDLVSPHPFWPVKNGLLSTYPPLQKSMSCDVVVVGAGITGALIAYALVEAGLQVVVVDRRDVASGSTSASTALVQYELDTPLTELIDLYNRNDAEQIYRLCFESVDRLAGLCGKEDYQCGFTRKESVYLASREKDVKALRAELAARQHAGITVEFLTSADIEARFSFSRPGALLSSQAAELDVFQLTHRLLAGSVRMGAQVFDRTALEKFEPAEDRFTALTARGHSIRARWGVLATGYESVKLLNRRVANLNSSYALVSEPLTEFPGWWHQCLLWETDRPYFYLRSTSDGRAMIGGEDDSFRSPSRRDARVPKKAGHLLVRFQEMFPAIPFEPAYAWAGTFAETKDGLASIGAVPEWPSTHFALCFGGNGITYSVIAAEIIRDAICGQPNETARLFSFDR